MTTLTFHGGINEVGGNKILVESAKAKVWLDFGMSFTQSAKFFDEFLQPRKCNGIGDFIEMGLLPNLKGLYREDYLRKMRINPGNKGYDAVLLSHAHADHSAYINFLRKDIPIFCSSESYLIMKALEDTSSTGFTDFINLYECFRMRPLKNNPDRLTKVKGEESMNARKIEIFKDKFSVNDINITVCPTCHSLAGSSAFLLEAKDSKIAYTGDFRFHGYKGELSKEFVRKAASFEPDVLICEGTRIDNESKESEDDVLEKADKVISECKKLIVVNFPIRDTDRLKTFYEVACNNDRDLVISLKQAYLLELLKGKVDVPTIDDKNVRIFIPFKDWGCFRDSRYPDYIQEADYDVWEREFIYHKNAVTAPDIKANEKDFIVRIDNFELKHLIDLRPSKGSIFIKSVCEPFNEEMFFDMQRVDNWLMHFGLYPAEQIHSSGHISGDEIKEVIEEIKPKLVIPVHTDKAETFKKIYDRTKIVDYGERVKI